MTISGLYFGLRFKKMLSHLEPVLKLKLSKLKNKKTKKPVIKIEKIKTSFDRHIS